jgi:hypothetical protein
VRFLARIFGACNRVVCRAKSNIARPADPERKHRRSWDKPLGALAGVAPATLASGSRRPFQRPMRTSRYGCLISALRISDTRPTRQAGQISARNRRRSSPIPPRPPAIRPSPQPKKLNSATSHAEGPRAGVIEGPIFSLCPPGPCHRTPRKAGLGSGRRDRHGPRVRRGDGIWPAVAWGARAASVAVLFRAKRR